MTPRKAAVAGRACRPAPGSAGPIRLGEVGHDLHARPAVLMPPRHEAFGRLDLGGHAAFAAVDEPVRAEGMSLLLLQFGKLPGAGGDGTPTRPVNLFGDPQALHDR